MTNLYFIFKTKLSQLPYPPYPFMLFFFIGAIFFGFLYHPADSCAKMKNIKWKSQPSTLQVGKTFRYRISGNPGKSKIRFSSNRPKRAKINAKSGKLHAKKQGAVIITAKVSKNNKSAKLKTKLKIISSAKGKQQNQNVKRDATASDSSDDSYLKNVQFTAADNINPWDHSLLLYSDRILLQKEVENTSLQLSPLSDEQNEQESYTASYVSLSSDGKCIRYQLSPDDAEKICPGNGTCDTEYSIRSSFFSNQLNIKYQERITANSLRGYVLSEKGKSLSGVLIQLISESSDRVLDTVRSDENGFYQFVNIPNSSIRLSASMKGFDTLNVKHLSPYGHALCQNLIMHPANPGELALSCRLADSSGKAISSVSVILTDVETQLSLQGQSNETGYITFSSSEDFNSADYSYIKYQNQLAPPVYENETLPTAEKFTCNPAFSFRRNTTYQLQIIPTLHSSAISDYHPLSFCFSFADIISDQILFDITLQELPVISSDNISINTDTLSVTPDHFACSLYSPTGDLLFQRILSAQNDTGLSKELNQALLETSLRLQDGDYFISFTAFDTDQVPISATEIQKIAISNGILNACDCRLSPASSLQVFLYAKISKEKIDDTVSFTLYQKFSSIYFPISNCYADNFSILNNSSCQSLLTLSGLKADTNYFLLPDRSAYGIASNLAPSESGSLENVLENAVCRGTFFHTKMSSFQIILTACEEFSENVTQNINLRNTAMLWKIPEIKLERDYFDSSNTYPNTVYAYHQKDGTLLDISFQSSTNISFTENSFIINCFKNGTDICTNQNSYRLTPFFVT